MDEPRILVVEDHELLRVAIQTILEAEGWNVLSAGDGLEGLEVMSQVCPDLILADIMMPRMDGLAFYGAVRARREWMAIPFIFLTAKTSREDALKGMELGAEDYITKPFEPEELVVAVRARLKRAEALRAVTEAEFDRLRQQIIAVPRQLLEAQEAERRSIARELHDEIG
jgi:DNA-binding response OmpR family regulator